MYIDSLTYEQFMMLGDAELSRRFSMQDEAEQKAKIDREQANELEYVDESQKSDASESANASSGSAGAKPVRNPEREKPKWEDTITNRMLHWSYTPEQKDKHFLIIILATLKLDDNTLENLFVFHRGSDLKYTLFIRESILP